jgi:hypothetical protein
MGLTRLRRAGRYANLPGVRRFRSLPIRAAEALASLGVHVLLRRYDDPVPDLSALADDFWDRTSQLTGLQLNEHRQLTLLQEFTSTYRDEYEAFPWDGDPDRIRFYLGNDRFGPVDAEVLYCMVRCFQPGRVHEVGSGFSTLLVSDALKRNRAEGRRTGTITVFDPYPSPLLEHGLFGVGEVVRARVQDVPLHRFEELHADDVLLIDSSHVLKTGSDVQFLYLDVIPRLFPGVLVHVHDVFLPKEYPQAWVRERRRFWNEQYLLQAFLAFNPAFEVLWAGSFLHVTRPDRLAAAFRSYQRRPTPGSFWIRRCA